MRYDRGLDQHQLYFMKRTLCLAIAIFISFAAGCEKKDVVIQSTSSSEPQTQSLNSFEEADHKLSFLTDQIENTTLSTSQRQKVLCIEYPKTYQEEYMPAFLALQPADTSQEKLIQEMQFTLNYYQQRFDINCS